MLGKKSDVATQIRPPQSKVIESQCQGHTLSLSVKDTTKSSRLLGEVMATAGEITTLVKYFPKREQLLGEIKQNIEVEYADDELYNNIESLSNLCATRWTVRATARRKIIANYQMLFNLCDLSPEENLNSKICPRVVGYQTQMTKFRFFYAINLAYTVYSVTDNFSKSLQKESLAAIEGKSTVMKTVKTFENMRNEEVSDLFFESLVKKASQFYFVDDPVLSRKRKEPNYRKMTDCYNVTGRSKSSEPYHLLTPKEHYRQTYFEVLDVMINSVKERKMFIPKYTTRFWGNNWKNYKS